MSTTTQTPGYSNNSNSNGKGNPAAGANTQPDDDGPDESWAPIDLRPAWRGEKVRPRAEVFLRDDGLALLPPGINYLFGDSGDGKSMVALIAALAEMRAGFPVVWATYEDSNEDLIIDRLRLLGATERDVPLLWFITPQVGLTLGADLIAELVIESGRPRLMVLDSVGEAMAVGGVNEDKDNEVGPWFRRTLRLIHDRCPDLAILPIDHSNKSRDNPLFPSGSKRKRAAVTGRSYLLNVRSSFAIGVIGYVQLIVAKDRGGTFKRGAIAAEIKLDATTVPYTTAVVAPREGDAFNPKNPKRATAERVLEVIGETSVPVTAEEITRIANGDDRKQYGEANLALKTVKNALTKLAGDPEVQHIVSTPDPGVGGRNVPDTWAKTKPATTP